MKFKFFKPLTALATMSLVLNACGGTPTATNSPAASPAAGASPATSPASSPAAGKFTVGVIMVGPKNDKGWSQGHYEAVTEYVTKKVPDVKVEFVDKVNPADRPNVKGSQVADDLIAKGAQVIPLGIKDADFGTEHFSDIKLAGFVNRHPLRRREDIAAAVAAAPCPDLPGFYAEAIVDDDLVGLGIADIDTGAAGVNGNICGRLQLISNADTAERQIQRFLRCNQMQINPIGQRVFGSHQGIERERYFPRLACNPGRWD